MKLIFLSKHKKISFLRFNKMNTGLSKWLFFYLLVVMGDTLSAQNIGIKTGAPNTVLDVNGSVALRESVPSVAPLPSAI